LDYLPRLIPTNGPEKQVLARLRGPGRDFSAISQAQHDPAGPHSPPQPPAAEDTERLPTARGTKEGCSVLSHEAGTAFYCMNTDQLAKITHI